ncbi:MAG: alpha/beta hydrolase [Proteobacteria bacterium]|nr:alpha/beta hydrolase [Pseudomonadota bacterium]
MNTTAADRMAATGTEIEFDVLGLRLCAKQWGDPNGEPVIGLHGWLDNANTFDRLAPLLPEVNLIALDFAGHGRSAHRAPGVHYHPLYDIQDVLAVANCLNWHQFHLIGHSMGGAIASELSAMFPDRVRSAVHIDGFLATGGNTPEDRIEQSRLAIEKILKPHHQARVFDSQEAMAMRVTDVTDQTLDASRVLVARGSKAVEGGVTWRTDPRIRYPTPLRHSREQIDLLLKDSTSPALLIVAEQGDTWYQGEIPDALQHHPNLTVERMDGPHHIHLEPDYVDQVAVLIRSFLGL